MTEREARTYESEGEFEADRQRMWERGWIVRRHADSDEGGRSGAWEVLGGFDISLGDSWQAAVVTVAIVVIVGGIAVFVRRTRSRRFKVTYERANE